MMTSIPTHLSVILLGNIYCFAYSLQMLTEELKKEQAAREGLKEVVATAESMLRAARAKISTLERQLKEARTMYEAAQRKQKDLENLVKNQVCLKIKRYIGYTYLQGIEKVTLPFRNVRTMAVKLGIHTFYKSKANNILYSYPDEVAIVYLIL